MNEDDYKFEVSIIVPVYNVEKFIRRCIESILSQTFRDFELILINDSSTDNSQQIIDEFSKKDKRIRSLRNDKNLGLGMTRNRGINEANGNYLMFIDSDDYVAKDYVESYYREISKDPVLDVVVGGYIKDVDGRLKRYPQKNCVWSVTTYPIACAKMFRKVFLSENELYFTHIRMGEDILFSLEAYCCGFNYKVLDYCGYFYFLNRSSITASAKKQRNQEAFIAEIYDKLMEKYELNKLSSDSYRIVEYTYLANMVNALVLYCKGASKKELREKSRFVLEDAKKRFPNYRNNPYIPLFAAKGQTFKIRFGVWSMMMAYRMKVDMLLLSFMSKV